MWEKIFWIIFIGALSVLFLAMCLSTHFAGKVKDYNLSDEE